MVIWEHMQIQTVKTTVEIDANLFYMAKMEALQEKKSLKEIINLCLAKNLKANQQKTVDLFSKIQSIVAGSGVSEAELQQSGKKIRKQLADTYYRKEKA